jgi:RNA polymerase sigma-70 factor (ECF subfamily)
MNTQHIVTERSDHEGALTSRFLDNPNEESFAGLFKFFTPQLVAFFRTRGCALALAEDLTQEVMLAVHRKAGQIRDRTLFRGWLFKIARNALYRHYVKRTREVETVDLEGHSNQLSTARNPVGTPAFEFQRWMALLDSGDRELITLRYIEEWQYHEIAAAKAMPIGTVQWRVFNAKKKLAPHLATSQHIMSKAA